MKHSTIIKTILLFVSLHFIFACSHEEKYVEPKIVEFTDQMKAVKVKKSIIPLYYEAVGSINAKTSTILASKVPGHIRLIKFEEGAYVKAGNLLIDIDDRDIQTKQNQAKASYDSAKRALDEIKIAIKQAKTQKSQAEANLHLAQTTFKRYQQLLKEKATSRQEFDTVKAKLTIAKAQSQSAVEGIAQLNSKMDQVKAGIEQAKSAVEEANVMQSYTKIHAPFDGVIIKKHIEIGGLAVPGTPLLTFENPDLFRLEVDVREKEFHDKVEIGCDVDVKVDALGDHFSKGKVAEVVPFANKMSRTFKVKIALPEMTGLKSGMYGRAICKRGEKEGILVNKSAVIRRGQLEQVFTVGKNNIAKLILVKTGNIYDDNIEILSGLEEGTVVIIDPKPNLKDQYKVSVEVL